MENKRIAELLDEIAAFISVEDFATARFEVRAYQKAALTIGTLQEPIEDVYRRGGLEALMELPGVGKSIASLIEEYLKTGRTKKYDMLKKKYPIDMAGLTSIQGLGAKRALILYKKLGIKNVEDLKKALEKHRIAKLKGFGKKSEEALQKGLAFLASGSGRVLISTALPVAEELVAKLKKSGLVERAMVAGSARRMRETVGDLDLLVISKRAEEVMTFFTKLSDVDSIIVKGPTKTSVRLKMGLNVDLRVLPKESFGASVLYFTGNKSFNIKVRTIAIEKGYKLNEYGLLNKKGRNVGGIEEEGIFKKLGLEWMPPEAREDRGEIELALKNRFPALVDLKDIRGDLHTHTNETDGANSLEEMAEAAMALGYQYIGSTDHTRSEPVAKGKNDREFGRMLDHVDKLNYKLEKEGKKFRVLKGAECDILKDGSLDLKTSTLKRMESVVGSVHMNVNMSEAEMTARVIKAVESGYIHILGHPTGRIVGMRDAFRIDLLRVAEACERNNVAMEVNSTDRLDLSDTNIMLVSKYKVKLAINTDAHRLGDYGLIRYGVGTARRGWVTATQVVNALDVKKLLKWLER